MCRLTYLVISNNQWLYNDMHEASNYILYSISYTALSLNVVVIHKQPNVDYEILNYNLQHIENRL